jgi:hypothetical protein
MVGSATAPPTVVVIACIWSSLITGGPGGGSPMALNGSARKAQTTAAPIRVTTAVMRRQCLIFVLFIIFHSFSCFGLLWSSLLTTHFQPFICVHHSLQKKKIGSVSEEMKNLVGLTAVDSVMSG